MDVRKILCEELECQDERMRAAGDDRPSGDSAEDLLEPVEKLLAELKPMLHDGVELNWAENSGVLEIIAQANRYRISPGGERLTPEGTVPVYRVGKNEQVLYNRKRQLVYSKEFIGAEDLVRHLSREFYRYVDPEKIRLDEAAEEGLPSRQDLLDHLEGGLHTLVHEDERFSELSGLLELMGLRWFIAEGLEDVDDVGLVELFHDGQQAVRHLLAFAAAQGLVDVDDEEEQD